MTPSESLTLDNLRRMVRDFLAEEGLNEVDAAALSGVAAHAVEDAIRREDFCFPSEQAVQRCADCWKPVATAWPVRGGVLCADHAYIALVQAGQPVPETAKEVA